jgi:hypothetical protein
MFTDMKTSVGDDENAAYAGHIEIFLQGSYGNDTNVYGKDSDVDVVMLGDRAYFRDLSRLTPAEGAAYEADAGGAPDPFATFKADVVQILKKKFGADVDTSSKKAVKVKANGNRQSADVRVYSPVPKRRPDARDGHRFAAQFKEPLNGLSSGNRRARRHPRSSRWRTMGDKRHKQEGPRP